MLFKRCQIERIKELNPLFDRCSFLPTALPRTAQWRDNKRLQLHSVLGLCSCCQNSIVVGFKDVDKSDVIQTLGVRWRPNL